MSALRLQAGRVLRSTLHALTLLTVLAALLPAVASGQASERRYLLIVETSRDMEGRRAEMMKTVREVFALSLASELRAGDTVGVWTFNEELYAGRLPLHRWSEAEPGRTVSEVLDFLGNQPMEKSGSFKPVSLALDRTMAGSDWLTVVVVSTGESDLEGTPFDDVINSYFKEWKSQQRKKHEPFVTVLRAAKGRWFSYRLNAAPWPTEMPALPLEEHPAPEVRPAAAAATNAPVKPVAPVMGQPLIMSGRKKAGGTNVVTNR
jgi:hypothetical protein